MSQRPHLDLQALLGETPEDAMERRQDRTEGKLAGFSIPGEAEEDFRDALSAPQLEPSVPRDQGGVGAELRAHRNRQRQSTATIAEALRINESHVLAFEAGNYTALPGKTFAVGFVRSYAEHLGLSADDYLRRFKAELTARAEVDDSLVAGLPNLLDRDESPVAPLLVMSVFALAALVGVWAWSERQPAQIASPGDQVPEEIRALAEGTPSATVPSLAEVEQAFRDPQTVGIPPGQGRFSNGAPLSGEAGADVTPGAAGQALPADVVTARLGDQAAPFGPQIEGVVVPFGPPQITGELGDVVPIVPLPKPQVLANSPEQVTIEPGSFAPERVALMDPTPDLLDLSPNEQPASLEAGEAATGTGVFTQAPGVEVEPSLAEPLPLVPAGPPTDYFPYSTIYGAYNIDSRMTLRAWERVMVRVERTSDGSVLMSRRLEPGESFRLPNDASLLLATPNAGALELVVDGQPTGRIDGPGVVLTGLGLEPTRFLARLQELRPTAQINQVDP